MKTSIQSANVAFSVLLAGALVLVGGTAFADSAPAIAASPLAAKTVKYDDLNLDTTQGAKVLYARLHQASNSVCAALNGRDVGSQMRWRKCVDSSLSAAVAQVNQRSLTALHLATIAPKG